MRRYTYFVIIFLFSLLIPTLLYIFRYKSITATTKIQQNDKKPFIYPSMVKYSYSWPINEQTNKTHINNNEDIYKHIDQKYCGRNKCRFLLPVVVGEQGKEKKKATKFLIKIV